MQWLIAFIQIAVALWPRDETISGYAERGAVYELVAVNGEAVGVRATVRFPRKDVVEGEGPMASAIGASALRRAIRVGLAAPSWRDP